jgi:elongation factor Ts
MAINETIKEQIKSLRQLTGAGFLDCRNALLESNQDINMALKKLDINSKIEALKLSIRPIKESTIFNFIHTGGKVAVLVELGCETDFVSRNDTFKKLGDNIAKIIAFSSDIGDTLKEEYSTNLTEKSYKIEQSNEINKLLSHLYTDYSNSPEALVLTVEDVLFKNIALFGENIKIIRFTKYLSIRK